MFDIFRKKKPGEKSAQKKHETQPRQQEQTREAKKKRRIAKVKEWGRFPWRRRLIIALSCVGVGLAIWFAILPSCSPTPTSYSLSVTTNPSGSGNVSPSYGNYTDGTKVTLTATPLPGYEFVSWSGGASGTSPTATITMNSDKSVTANFHIIQYTLATSVSPLEGGSLSPSSGTYASGSSVTLTATPLSGYEFVSWSGDASGTSPTATITMNSDKSVTANFHITQYTLATSVRPPEGGSLSPSSGTYASSSSVTLTATPLSGYEFVSWSGDASGTSPTVTITMNSDKSVTANFLTIMQKITCTMPTGKISGSVVSFSNTLKRGDLIEGFVELTGQYYSQDRSFRWTFEILGPEGSQIEYWTGGHWVKRTHRDFSFTAPYNGSYKIRVTHNSLYDKQLVIKIRPKGW